MLWLELTGRKGCLALGQEVSVSVAALKWLGDGHCRPYGEVDSHLSSGLHQQVARLLKEIARTRMHHGLRMSPSWCAFIFVLPILVFIDKLPAPNPRKTKSRK